MPKFTIDGKEISVEPGTTILQAAKAHGIQIPYFCWHPKLSIDGSCRMCQVEVEKMPKLQIACNTPVLDGMVVRTQTSKVEDARRAVMELLLINHPLDCPICDQAGECKLQNYCFDYGVPHSRYIEPKRQLQKRVDIGPRVLLDEERCILCRRCVRFCREVSKTGELTVHNRGDSERHRHLPRAAARQPLLDLHVRHLPGRRAHRQGFPVQGAGLVPQGDSLGLHGLRRRLQHQRLGLQGSRSTDSFPAGTTP